MIKKIISYCLVMLLLLYTTHAQNRYPSIPTPNAYSFAKFVEVPVNEYNGIPDISIPIYTIKDGKVEIPITLRYHAGGIKVREQASWVGLGWNLDIGGMITQIIEGYDDNFESIGRLSNISKSELYKGKGGDPSQASFDNWFMSAFLNYVNTNSPRFDYTRSSFTCQGTSSEIYNPLDIAKEYHLIKDLQNGYYKPDIYTYSINGTSGKFVFSNPDDWTIAKDVRSNIDFSYDGTTMSAKSPDGKIYSFDADYYEESTIYKNDVIQRDYNTGFPIVSSRNFYLSNITYPNGESVDFGYTKLPETFSLPELVLSSSSGPGYEEVNKFSNKYTPVFLTSIKTKNFEVHFFLKDREDISGEKCLDSIIVKDLINNKSKRFNFITDYFVSDKPSNCYSPAEGTNLKRLRLKRFEEQGNPAGYDFMYNELPLPPKTSYALDYWGFYNGKDDNKTIMPSLVGLGSTDFSSKANRGPDAFAMQASILKQIIYPTQGTTSFEYEPNTFSNVKIESANYKLIDYMVSDQNGSTDINSKDFNIPFEQTVFLRVVFAPGRSRTIYDMNNSASASIVNIDDGTYYPISLTNICNGTQPGDCDNSEVDGYSQNTKYEYPWFKLPAGNYKVAVDVPDDWGACGTDNNALVQVSFSVKSMTSTSNSSSFGAGLRIKSITSSPLIGKSIKKHYSYFSGSLMSPIKYVGEDPYRTITIVPGFENSPSIYSFDDYFTSKYSSNSSIALSSDAQGAFVGYDMIRIYSDLGFINKEFINEISVSTSKVLCNKFPSLGPDFRGVCDGSICQQNYDEQFYNGNSSIALPPIPYLENGMLKKETVYDENGHLKSEKSYSYKNICNNSFFGTIVQENYSGPDQICINQTKVIDCRLMKGRFLIYNYPILNYKTVLTSKIEKEYYGENVIFKNTDYDYNKIGQLSNVSFFNSLNKKIVKIIKYPLDFDPSSNSVVLNNMRNNNMLDYVVEQQELVDGNVTNAVFNNYNSDGTVKEEYTTELSSPIPSASFIGLDNNGVPRSGTHYKLNTSNISIGGYLYQTQKNDDQPISYLWGSNNLPIAEVKNALSNEVYFDSYEENSANSTSRFHSGGKSLKTVNTRGGEIYYHTLELKISNTSEKQYKASCWVYSEGPTTQLYFFYNTSPTPYVYSFLNYKDNSIINKWVYLEVIIDVPAKAKSIFARIDNNSNGTVYFDDIRIQPVNAQMTTYTYGSWNNITSVTGPDNQSTYYEYDSFGRLMDIKNDQGNILKHYEYNYAK